MRLVAWVVLAAGLLAGCDWFEDRTPEEVRVVIKGDAGKQVRLITSTRFVAAVNEIGQTRVVIFESDTTVITLPHDRVYSLRGDPRFFAEAARQDADFQSLRMEVYVDRRKEFDEGGPLTAGQPYRFLFTFNQQITREIVVI
ncbi:MAG: hypothetical protein ACRENP_01345 [Longimicrobiales bacterium]